MKKLLIKEKEKLIPIIIERLSKNPNQDFKALAKELMVQHRIQDAKYRSLTGLISTLKRDLPRYDKPLDDITKDNHHSKVIIDGSPSKVCNDDVKAPSTILPKPSDTIPMSNPHSIYEVVNYKEKRTVSSAPTISLGTYGVKADYIPCRIHVDSTVYMLWNYAQERGFKGTLGEFLSQCAIGYFRDRNLMVGIIDVRSS